MAAALIASLQRQHYITVDNSVVREPTQRSYQIIQSTHS